VAQVNRFGAEVGGRPALVLRSSDEPGELLQWLCYDDSTMNVVVGCYYYCYRFTCKREHVMPRVNLRAVVSFVVSLPDARELFRLELSFRHVYDSASVEKRLSCQLVKHEHFNRTLTRVLHVV